MLYSNTPIIAVFLCEIQGNRKLHLEIPKETTAVLMLDGRENIPLETDGTDTATGLTTYILKGGTKITLTLEYL